MQLYDPGQPQLMLPAPLPAGSITAPPRWNIPEHNMPVTPDNAIMPPGMGSFMQQAQQMGGSGVTSPGAVPYAQPMSQGPLTRAAYQMAGAPPQPSMIPGANASPALPGMTSPTSLLGGSGGGSSGTAPNNKFAGAASGAAAGLQAGGPWGALVGAGVGYAASGGVKDMNPVSASGFSGKTMDQAWKDQDLMRLASNPAASVASKLGVNSNSLLGKALDPSSFFSKHGDEKRNLSAFTKENQITDLGNGMLALPNGAQFPKDQLQKIAGAWYGATYHPDGDQSGWQDKYNTLLYSQPQPNLHLGG